ncbi:MAG: transcription-repair coupling factor [Calditrichaeota bacterium]|nr:MAG: transcription-repair coupling factor [Calditrichota bacterium]MBL1205956.1 transcription-repair coupling factor [Calditrichota bacterium]NOG45784.1 transcription-repair coupling factor [Calditrichota bacterium]
MDAIKSKIFSISGFQKLASSLKSSFIHLKNVQGSFGAFVNEFVAKESGAPLLYIANSLESAEKMHDDLEFLKAHDKLAFLPGLFLEPYETSNPRPELVSMRLEAMQVFLEADQWIAVCTYESLLEKLPLPETFVDNQVYTKIGLTLAFDDLISQLDTAGFERVDIVEQVGEFSVRGGIIDIFAWNNEEPVRLEYFGNVIESIRTFDVITQRTTGNIEEFAILPHLTEHNADVFLHDLLPQNTTLFFEDSDQFYELVRRFYDQAVHTFEQDESLKLTFEEPGKMYCTPEFLQEKLNTFKQLNTNLVANDSFKKVDFKTGAHPDFNGSIKLFLEYLTKKVELQNGRQFIIQSHSVEQANRLQEIIEEEDIVLNAKYAVGTLHGGFVLDELDFEILTDHEIFKRFKRHKAYRSFKSGAYLRQLGGLSLYDYVVHIDYGIGQYMGLDVINYGTVKKECLKIVYRDGDNLFVTVDRLNRVQKFSTEEGGTPKLSKLGTAEWERTKTKTKESLKKVAAELIQIYAGRKAQSGFSFEEDNHWQKELEASFEFEETEDQITSIQAVKKDMEDVEPMDRLLCGDVGFGKTEVALRAAFKAVMAGKQVAILVPTTILAFQHFETFKKRVTAFPVKVEMLNRFRSAKQQRLILEGLAAGRVDIIIATHRLLSNDIQFKDLGLLVVDEEQRFGVKHKEKLKKYRLSVDILSMTATPIPRTLHMALMGARDFSQIETPPRNRIPVHTEIIQWNDAKIHHVIKREMQRGGQIYFVHNRVESILAIKEAIAEIVPEAKIAVGHGQLPEKQLEKVMLDFMHQKYDILVATMIIENGLDIPNVNTILINRADKFGLSQLYQLRGRVGRSDKQAYAYLVVPGMDKITELSRKRLRTIQDFTELGSGYKVALRDLEIRGAGNLLGKQQSGFVQTVGFDLYCKILDEAVAELRKGLDTVAEDTIDLSEKTFTDPKLDLDFDLLIPENYIHNELERVSIYHRLVNFREVDSVDQMRLELRDRFGELPDEVGAFLEAIKLKVLAGYMYAKRLILNGPKLKIIFADQAQEDDRFFNETIPEIMNHKLTKVNFLNQKDLGVQMMLEGKGPKDRLEFAKKVLQNIVK